MEVEEEGSDSLRRSTRGGGHKAPEAKTAKLRSVSSKKAKTAAVDGKAEEGGAAGDVGSGSASGTGNGNGVAAPPTAPTADGVAEGVPTEEKGVPVPENNIDAAKETESKTKSGKIEVGEILPAGIVLKNEQDEDVTIADLTKEKGAVFFVYPKVRMRSFQSYMSKMHHVYYHPRRPIRPDVQIKLATSATTTPSLVPWDMMVCTLAF